MKKHLMIIAIATISFSLFAQDEPTSDKSYLPKQGDFSISTDIGALLRDIDLADLVPAFGFKYMTKDNQAIRLEFIFNRTSVETPDTNDPDPDAMIKVIGSDLGVGLGYEWRGGGSRVQGFGGFQTDVIYSKIKVPAEGFDDPAAIADIVFGVQGFLGAECFIIPQLSLGGQLSWGPSYAIMGIVDGEADSNVFNIGTTAFDGSLILSFYF